MLATVWDLCRGLAAFAVVLALFEHGILFLRRLLLGFLGT